jgi:hypothetical protein
MVRTISYRAMRYFRRNFFCARFIIAVVLMIGSCLASAQTPSREYQLKAAFLFNFTRFVEWPPSSLPADETPLVIGILGANPFGSFLEELVSGEKVNGHPVIITQYKNTDDIKKCHILFINLSDPKKQGEAIADLRAKSILMVSDNASFLGNGGMIRLFTKDNKIKMEVNVEASKAAGLIISSKLLRLADIYISKAKKLTDAV